MRKRAKEERAQGVLEFLVSYAWMFLIIGIVAYVLYILGAYVPYSVPHQTGGNCQVSRPYGPYTTELVSLEGTCNNLLPSYVGELSQAGGGHIIIPLTSPSISSNQITITFWLTITGSGKYPQNILCINGTPEAFYIYQQGTAGNTTTPWQFVALTIDTSIKNTNNTFLYINDSLVDSKKFEPTTSTGVNIGGAIKPYGLYGLNGDISNLQVYDTILSQSQLNELFVEGLGGEPIQLTNLLAWWPLNGNTNDYSGNDRSSGAEAGIAFSGLLVQNYSTP